MLGILCTMRRVGEEISVNENTTAESCQECVQVEGWTRYEGDTMVADT